MAPIWRLFVDYFNLFMLDTVFGFKQKMGAVYLNDRRYPVTWVKVDPSVVTQIKNEEKDGYFAVQLGMGHKSAKNLTKPLQNHLKNVAKDKIYPRFIREIRLKEASDLNVGSEVKLTDVLKNGDIVTVTGISKGKGFAGVVKRWKFAGGPKTHGQSDRERAPGSIGNRTTPGRVWKGKRMAGRMGSDQVTVKSLNVIDIDEKENLVAITGAVPGAIGRLVIIRKTGEGEVKKVDQLKEVEQVEKVEPFDSAQGKQVEEAKKEEEVKQADQVGKVEQVEEIKKEEVKTEEKSEEATK